MKSHTICSWRVPVARLWSALPRRWLCLTWCIGVSIRCPLPGGWMLLRFLLLLLRKLLIHFSRTCRPVRGNSKCTMVDEGRRPGFAGRYSVQEAWASRDSDVNRVVLCGVGSDSSSSSKSFRLSIGQSKTYFLGSECFRCSVCVLLPSSRVEMQLPACSCAVPECLLSVTFASRGASQQLG